MKTYIYSLKARLRRTKIRVGHHQKEHIQFRQHTDARPVTLSLKHKEPNRWNELSYIVGCARFFLGLPGFAYRLLIWAAVLCSNRFPSCSFGLHTWQIHIPGGGPGKRERERNKKEKYFKDGSSVCSHDTFKICLCSTEKRWPTVLFPLFPQFLEEKE